MNKKISVGAMIAAVAVAVAITFCVTVNAMTERFDRQLGEVQEMKGTYEKMREIDNTVAQNAYYTVTDTLRDDNIGRAYAAALQEAGDRYAYYMTAEEYAAREEASAGKSDGFGIVVRKDSGDTMLITQVIHGSPAFDAGLRPADIVLSIADGEGSVLASGPYDKLAAVLQNVSGPVTLTVLRGEEEKTFSVTPGDYTVDSAYVQRVGNTAVVHITAFNADTDEQFLSLINGIAFDEDVTGVVFDLRQNGGGLLASVVNMLDRLLPEGIIVTEKDRSGKETARFTSDATSLNLPMAVLVDDATASAAELFACALRDYGKAKLVGTATYGKGCVQTTYTFPDGSALCFTTALYYPPASDNFDGTPLAPDVAVTLSEEEKQNFYSLTEKTDPQLAAALELVRPHPVS